MKILITNLLWFLMAGAPLALPTCAAATPKASSTTPAAVIDINRASAQDLARLPGVGPKLAQQIVDYRTKQGPFRRVEDLLIIRGIGNKKWEALRPFVCAGCKTAGRTPQNK